MLKYFPLTVEAKKDIIHLAVVIVAYWAITFVAGIAAGLIAWIPLVGWVVFIAEWLVRVYCGVGALVAILAFFNVLK